MLRLEHHRRIATLLGQLKPELLRRHHCLFGGGTAIALRYGEFRQSVDVDLLVSDRQGYRELRQLIRRDNSLAHLPLTPASWGRALAKAEEAYGDAVRTDLAKALERLQQREGWLERCRQVLAIEAPRAALWQRLINLQRLAAAPAAPAPD